MNHNTIVIDGKITLDEIIKVSRYNYKIKLSNNSVNRINKARTYIDNKDNLKEMIYGVNTGIGKLCCNFVGFENQEQYQKNILLSHACGCGENYSIEIVRAAMLLLINSIAKGYSGTSLCVVNFYIKMLNENIIPVVPQKGSLGASSDLVPLAHMALPLIGHGKVFFKRKMYHSKSFFKQKNIKLVKLKSKDALSIINGTHFMTAIGSLIAYDSHNLIKIADCSAALTVEALNGIYDDFSIKTHLLRPHTGQLATAKNLNILLNNSEYISDHFDKKVQDAYSIRCIPQVHGASKDAFNYTRNVIETEINSVTDNPLIFADDDVVLSGGNFHGQPLAIAYDFLGIALSELCNIS